jgi:ABC-type phosphate transport system substrate-binding protein
MSALTIADRGIVKNSISIKNSTNISSSSVAGFCTNIANKTGDFYNSIGGTYRTTASNATSGSTTIATNLNNGSIKYGFLEFPTIDTIVNNSSSYIQIPIGVDGIAIIYNLPGINSFQAKAGDFSLIDSVWEYTPGEGTNTGSPIVNNGLSVTNPLILDGGILADIYDGTIKKWNDSKILELNNVPISITIPVSAGENDNQDTTTTCFIKLKNLFENNSIDIIPVSYANVTVVNTNFTDYLNKFKNDVFSYPRDSVFSSYLQIIRNQNGANSIASTINEFGLLNYVNNTTSSIGFVNYSSLNLSSSPTIARIKNMNQEIVTLNKASLYSAAVNGYDSLKDVFSPKIVANTNNNTSNFSITNASGTGSYPIARFAYAIAKKQTETSNENAAIAKFLIFITQIGQGSSTGNTFGQNVVFSQTNSSPLPPALSKYALDNIKTAFGNNVSESN